MSEFETFENFSYIYFIRLAIHYMETDDKIMQHKLIRHLNLIISSFYNMQRLSNQSDYIILRMRKFRKHYFMS